MLVREVSRWSEDSELHLHQLVGCAFRSCCLERWTGDDLFDVAPALCCDVAFAGMTHISKSISEGYLCVCVVSPRDPFLV